MRPRLQPSRSDTSERAISFFAIPFRSDPGVRVGQVSELLSSCSGSRQDILRRTEGTHARTHARTLEFVSTFMSSSHSIPSPLQDEDPHLHEPVRAARLETEGRAAEGE